MQISRRHTKYAYRDMRQLTAWVVGRLGAVSRTGASNRRIQDGARRRLARSPWLHPGSGCAANTPAQISRAPGEGGRPSYGRFRPLPTEVGFFYLLCPMPVCCERVRPARHDDTGTLLPRVLGPIQEFMTRSGRVGGRWLVWRAGFL